MKFHWTTAVIQILSHLLLPLFCWLCLLHQQPPPQQRFRDKTGMPRTGTFTTLSSFRFPFIVSTIPFATHPAENHQAMGSDCASHLLGDGKTQSSTYFSIPRLHSWQDQEWIILSSLIVGLHARLCEEHDSRSSQRGRAEKNETAMQQCVRLQAPGEHWEDLGKPWHVGLTIYTLNSRTSQSYLEQAQLLRLFSWCRE